MSLGSLKCRRNSTSSLLVNLGILLRRVACDWQVEILHKAFGYHDTSTGEYRVGRRTYADKPEDGISRPRHSARKAPIGQCHDGSWEAGHGYKFPVGFSLGIMLRSQDAKPGLLFCGFTIYIFMLIVFHGFLLLFTT
jgi:hypothetical protein